MTYGMTLAVFGSKEYQGKVIVLPSLEEKVHTS